MGIRCIKVNELTSYIASDEFAKQSIIPISRLRAISQAHNPSADPDDYALILSVHKEEILGYIGILPCCVYWQGKKYKVYSNSGWWVHPEKGRNSAMPLFYTMLQICGDKLFFSDLTPHTTNILKRTHLFNFPEPTSGLKIIFKFSLSTLLPRKFPKLACFKRTLSWADQLFNLIFLPLNKIGKSSFDTNISLQKVEYIDHEISDFIDLCSEYKAQFRKRDELNWILKYPWLRISDKAKDEESLKYYFSTTCREFTNYCYKIFRNSELIGFVMLTSRNRVFKMPYYFCKECDADLIFKVVDNLLYNLKAISFTTWQADYLHYFEKNYHFSLYKKKLIKQEAFSTEFPVNVPEMVKLQDGDADMVFT